MKCRPSRECHIETTTEASSNYFINVHHFVVDKQIHPSQDHVRGVFGCGVARGRPND